MCVIYCLWKEMFVRSLIKHHTAIEYVTSEGQYHTKLERYCTTFSVSPWLMNMCSFMELM